MKNLSDDRTEEMVADYRRDIEWLQQHGFDQWNEDDAKEIADFVSNIRWLKENGFKEWSKDDVETASTIRSRSEES